SNKLVSNCDVNVTYFFKGLDFKNTFCWALLYSTAPRPNCHILTTSLWSRAAFLFLTLLNYSLLCLTQLLYCLVSSPELYKALQVRSTALSSKELHSMCTENGWTPISIDSYIMDCGYNPNSTSPVFAIKVGYTIGHSMSLISLTIAIIILCLFRKLHCTRNYIHMHLFVSFILKAVAVLIKDVVLYDVGETENCQSSVGCKAVVVFFQYGIMASYFWLLVEGLYLHTLLAVSFFSEKKYFWWYILIGWGTCYISLLFYLSLIVLTLSSGRCWETINDNPWWIIKIPILGTILVNFFLFIFIIRILRQKMNCPDIGRKESNQRLAKSTLLLIPLFGINYIIFAFIPDHIHPQVRMVFDLILGSFQGFVVAVLYCFLNGEVSGIKQKLFLKMFAFLFTSLNLN
uniref:Vasoactive intestinal peptide receptor 1a n=1 Tax=Echeneis naucrates TaxID=173247 RepID=A0A665X9Q7_ECHNA